MDSEMPSSASQTPPETPQKKKKKVLSSASIRSKIESEKRRSKTRINIGAAFGQWRELRSALGIKRDPQMAVFLLNSYKKSAKGVARPSSSTHCKSSTATSSKEVAMAHPPSSITTGDSERVNMVKIEEVIVGDEVGTMPVEIKTEPVVTLINGSQVGIVPVEMKMEPVATANTPSQVETPPLDMTYLKENHECFKCLITFPNTKAWVRHMKKCHKELYKEHLLEANTLFTCYNCEKSFTTSEALSKHQAVHLTEEKPFSCSYCCKLFLSYSELNEHRRLECRERRSPCTRCGIMFSNISQLHRHVMEVHPEGLAASDDIYDCPKCGRVFKDIDDLLLHQEEFGDQKNCEAKPPERKRVRKIMNDEGSDKKKMKASNSTTEGGSSSQLMIPCPEGDCELIFHSIEALRTHKKEAHRPPPGKASGSEYLCFICGKTFTRESALKAHQISHTKEEEGEEEEGR